MDTSTPHLDTTKAVALAGLIGSVLSLSFIEDMGKRQRCTSVVAGIIMAHYLSPLIANLFHEGDYEPTVGFLVGLFGMSICASIFRAIKTSDLWGLVKTRFGTPKDTFPPPGGDL